MWQLRRNAGSETPVGAHRTEPTLAPSAEPPQSAVSSRMVALKVQIHQRYKLADAAQAHRDLEARKTTGASVLFP